MSTKTVMIKTKDISLVMHSAVQSFMTYCDTQPACLILSEKAWLQLCFVHPEMSKIATFQDIPVVVSRAMPDIVEIVGYPGILQSFSVPWSSDSKRA